MTGRLMTIFEFLKPKSGLSEAKQRAKEVEKQMKWLLKQDPQTFKAGLKKLGLNEGDEEYKQALKIYEETS
jgi:hypothetical protein